jgi:hypothetical protein
LHGCRLGISVMACRKGDLDFGPEKAVINFDHLLISANRKWRWIYLTAHSLRTTRKLEPAHAIEVREFWIWFWGQYFKPHSRDQIQCKKLTSQNRHHSLISKGNICNLRRQQITLSLTVGRRYRCSCYGANPGIRFWVLRIAAMINRWNKVATRFNNWIQMDPASWTGQGKDVEGGDYVIMIRKIRVEMWQ